MNKAALFAALLATACGGSNKPAPVQVGDSTHATQPSATPAVATVDPNLEFRKQFVNPGGMWMPAQMTLPQHIDNFKKMGVKLPAEALANPLSEPLASIVSLGGCSASFVSPDGLIV